MSETIQCEVCGQFFRFLPNHIKVHGLNSASYKEKFGNCKMIPDDIVQKCISAMNRTTAGDKNPMKRPEVRAYFSELKKGAPTGCFGRKGKDHYRYGKHHTEETCKRMSEQLTALRHTEEWSKQQSERILKAWRDPVKSRNMLCGQRAHPNYVEIWLTKFFDEFFPGQVQFTGDRKQKFTVGTKIPDFRVLGKDGLIEFFGDHWHSIEDEQYKRQYFLERGYKLLVLWTVDVQKGREHLKCIVSEFLTTLTDLNSDNQHPSQDQKILDGSETKRVEVIQPQIPTSEQSDDDIVRTA